MYASSIAEECCSGLNIGSPPLLSNKFSISLFDYSSGYFSILSDLLISENYCGYVKSGVALSTVSLSSLGSGSSRVLTEGDVISVGSTGSSSITGGTFVVNYSSLKLKDPDPVDPDLDTDPNDPTSPNPIKYRDWEEDIQTGSKRIIYINYTNRNGNLETYSFAYTPFEKTVTTYDEWDRVVKRETFTKSIGAALNPSYVQQSVEYDLRTVVAGVAGGRAVGFGKQEFEGVAVTYITYKMPVTPIADTYNYPDGYPLPEIFGGIVETTNDLPDEPAIGEYYQIETSCYKEYIFDGQDWIERIIPKAEQGVYPEGYDEVDYEVTEEYSPNAEIYGSVYTNYVDDNDNFLVIPDGNTLSSRTTITYETIKRTVLIADPETTQTVS